MLIYLERPSRLTPGLGHIGTHTDKNAKQWGNPRMYTARMHHWTSPDQTNDTSYTKKGTEGQTNCSIR